MGVSFLALPKILEGDGRIFDHKRGKIIYFNKVSRAEKSVVLILFPKMLAKRRNAIMAHLNSVLCRYWVHDLWRENQRKKFLLWNIWDWPRNRVESTTTKLWALIHAEKHSSQWMTVDIQHTFSLYTVKTINRKNFTEVLMTFILWRIMIQNRQVSHSVNNIGETTAWFPICGERKCRMICQCGASKKILQSEVQDKSDYSGFVKIVEAVSDLTNRGVRFLLCNSAQISRRYLKWI